MELDDAGVEQVQAVEQGADLGVAAGGERDGGLVVVGPHGRGHLLGGDVAGGVRESQVAARRHGPHQPGHQGGRLVLVGDAVQDAEEHDRDRPAEVQDLGGPGQDRVEVAQVGVDVGGRTLGAAGQQGPGVQEHDRVVVHVHDAGMRRHPLGYFVRIVPRGQPSPDVQELPDARFGHQVVHRPAEERPLRPDADQDVGEGLHDLFGRRPVDREIVLAPQPVVIHPRDMRHARVNRHAPAFGLQAAHHPGPSLRLTLVLCPR